MAPPSPQNFCTWLSFHLHNSDTLLAQIMQHLSSHWSDHDGNDRDPTADCLHDGRDSCSLHAVDYAGMMNDKLASFRTNVYSVTGMNFVNTR